MDLNSLLKKVKSHPDFQKAGMVLCHNGVVRQTSRDGRNVSGLRIKVNHARLEDIIAKHRQYPGIIDILVEINADRDLKVGDDVMYIVVAGDIRENVIQALSDTLNAVKSEATEKTQYFS